MKSEAISGILATAGRERSWVSIGQGLSFWGSREHVGGSREVRFEDLIHVLCHRGLNKKRHQFNESKK
jgi:hypothetical protein